MKDGAQDIAQDMEDKEVSSGGPLGSPANSRARMFAIRQTLSQPKEIHRGIQGSGPIFDFGFAFGDSIFSDCTLRLYIEATMEESWDVESEEEGAEEVPDFTEPGAKILFVEKSCTSIGSGIVACSHLTS